MAARRTNDPNASVSRLPPATTPEGRENQLISAAVELAERQLRDGTASAQVVTHFLKLGSSRERLEQDRLAHEVELMKIKKEAIESQARVEAMYADALNAMRGYAGQEPIQQPEEYDD